MILFSSKKQTKICLFTIIFDIVNELSYFVITCIDFLYQMTIVQKNGSLQTGKRNYGWQVNILFQKYFQFCNAIIFDTDLWCVISKWLIGKFWIVKNRMNYRWHPFTGASKYQFYFFGKSKISTNVLSNTFDWAIYAFINWWWDNLV